MAKRLKRKKSKAQSAQQAPQLDLKITTESIETLQISMAIEVNSDRVDYELRQAARKVSKDYKLPGFRMGRAPYPVIAERLGTEVLYNEFVEKLFDEVYPVALEQEELEAYGSMVFDKLDTDPSLVYRVRVPLEPVVELGDYRSLAVDEIVTEGDVNEQLDAHRQRLASWTHVERSSQSGDTVNIDVKSLMLAKDGSVTEEIFIEETDLDIILDPNEDSAFSGLNLDEALIGLSADEEKEVVLEWPADSQSIYAGRQAQFSIKVNGVEEYDVPELNDELVQMLDPDCESLEALRATLRKALIDHAIEDPNNLYLNKALDMVLENSTLQYPATAVEEQVDSMVQNHTLQLRQQFGVENLESYLEQSNQTTEEYRAQFREQAELAVRRNLVLFEVAKAEGLEIQEEDIEERIQELLETAGPGVEEAEKNLRSEQMVTMISTQLLQERAGDLVFDVIYGNVLDSLSDELGEDDEWDEDDLDGEADGETDADAPAEQL